MPIGKQDYRVNVGEFSYKTHHYCPDTLINSQLRRMAALQIDKVPQKPCPQAWLALTGILTNLTLGTNSSVTLVHEPAAPKCTTGNRQLLSQSARRVTAARYTDVAPISVLALPGLCRTPAKQVAAIADARALTFTTTVQSVASHIYQNMRDGIQRLQSYDPLRFPAADAAIPPPTTSVATTVMSDQVVIEKIDFSCIEQQDDLSTSEVLRSIQEALENPVTDMAKKIMYLRYFSETKPCPSEETMDKVVQVTSVIDDIITEVSGAVPQLSSLSIAKKIIAPILGMVADSLDNKPISVLDVIKIHDEILSTSKAMIDLTMLKSKHETQMKKLEIPRQMFLDSGALYINMDGQSWPLAQRDGHFYVSKNGLSRQVTYDNQMKVWQSDNIETALLTPEQQDHFFTRCHFRAKRGGKMGVFCGVNVDEELELAEPWASVSSSQQSYSVLTPEQNSLIERLDLGISDVSSRVTKLQFKDDWVVYRIRVNNKLRSPFIHAIEMNGKLVPVRAKQINRTHIRCEVYDPEQSQISHVVEVYKGRWQFETATSPHLSKSAKQAIAPELYATDVEPLHLSSANERGIKFDSAGRGYIKIDNNFVKIRRFGEGYYIPTEEGDRYNFIYVDNEFIFVNAELHQRKLLLNAEQLKKDRLIYSEQGLESPLNLQLNEAWTLMSVNLKKQKFDNAQVLGSKIDVTLRLKYTSKHGKGFIELPPLRWKEKIKHQKGTDVWQFEEDMYVHNHNSITFFPWNYRYDEAYNFSTHANKDSFRGLVRLFDKNMQPLEYNTLPPLLPGEPPKLLVKEYLAEHGGYLDVTISDLPHMKREQYVSKERLINFDIGFHENSAVKFTQAIILPEVGAEYAFVTTSPHVHVAIGETNIATPESVSRRRIKKATQLYRE